MCIRDRCRLVLRLFGTFISVLVLRIPLTTSLKPSIAFSASGKFLSSLYTCLLYTSHPEALFPFFPASVFRQFPQDVYKRQSSDSGYTFRRQWMWMCRLCSGRLYSSGYYTEKMEKDSLCSCLLYTSFSSVIKSELFNESLYCNASFVKVSFFRFVNKAVSYTHLTPLFVERIAIPSPPRTFGS